MKTKGIPRQFIDWLLLLAPYASQIVWFALGFLFALIILWARGDVVVEGRVHAAVACVEAGLSERTCLEIVGEE